MHGSPFFFMAQIGIPTAWQCFIFAAPFLAVASAWWLIDRIEMIVDRLFPSLEWERKLGWLNIRAQRKAEAVLRWLGYTLYAILAVALYGIVWGVQALPSLDRLDDPVVMEDLLRHVPVLLVSLGFWLVYLGCGLIPKLCRQQETEDLEKFRDLQKEAEKQRDQAKADRAKSLVKPRMEMPARYKRTGFGN